MKWRGSALAVVREVLLLADFEKTKPACIRGFDSNFLNGMFMATIMFDNIMLRDPFIVRLYVNKLLDDFFGQHPAAFLEPALQALAVEVHSAFVAGQHAGLDRWVEPVSEEFKHRGAKLRTFLT